MAKCWICRRSYAEVSNLVSEMPTNLKNTVYADSAKEFPYPICVICRMLIKYVAIEGVKEGYTSARSKENQTK